MACSRTSKFPRTTPPHPADDAFRKALNLPVLEHGLPEEEGHPEAQRVVHVPLPVAAGAPCIIEDLEPRTPLLLGLGAQQEHVPIVLRAHREAVGPPEHTLVHRLHKRRAVQLDEGWLADWTHCPHRLKLRVGQHRILQAEHPQLPLLVGPVEGKENPCLVSLYLKPCCLPVLLRHGSPPTSPRAPLLVSPLGVLLCPRVLFFVLVLLLA
mmetsp:Transcript_34759/g.85528  ORF Transcript_34759/g.85528 Transcript_34759/m.85528 type:complete len:210 (+) Transcript_34759:242-871(+)